MGFHASSTSYSGSKRIMLFIDGGYLRKQFKDLMGHENIDYLRLAKNITSWVTRGTLSPQLIRAYYYDGFLTYEDISRMDNITDSDHEFAVNWLNEISPIRQEYLDKIRNTDYYDVRLGSLRISNEKIFQKGVDVLLSIDMISKAYEQQYDEAVIIAGDRDFVKAVEAVKQIGATVLGIYFDGHISTELRHAFDFRKQLTVSDIGNWGIDSKLNSS